MDLFVSPVNRILDRQWSDEKDSIPSAERLAFVERIDHQQAFDVVGASRNRGLIRCVIPNRGEGAQRSTFPNDTPGH
jgi:hypothetical protein